MNQDQLLQQIEALIHRVEALEADNEALRKAVGLAKSAEGRVVRMSDGAVFADDA